jgi:peptidoglycan hydrolase-like protein with peptidoglycan-binding domain
MSQARRHRYVVLTVLALVIAVVAAACGGGDDDSVSTGDGTTTTAQRNISEGSDGNDVLEVQRQLAALGCDPGPLDGKSGPDTEAAIRQFQATNSLQVDGIVGPSTRAVLTATSAAGTPRCPTTPPPPAPTPATGAPDCTQDAITIGITASLKAGEQLFSMEEFDCSGIWAVSIANIGVSQQGAGQVTELLRWNGSAWQVVDRGVYCDQGEVPSAISGQACAATTSDDILTLQRELASLGCNPGPLDGKLGPDTKAGIRHFQQTAGLTVDGVAGTQTRAALARAITAGAPRCPATPPPTAPSGGGGGGGGGTPPCTEAAIRPVVQASLSPGEQMFKLNEFNCAITWAVATPTVGSTQQNAVEITVLLRWNGSAWQAVDRGVYCGQGAVPPAIVQKACNSN